MPVLVRTRSAWPFESSRTSTMAGTTTATDVVFAGSDDPSGTAIGAGSASGVARARQG